MVVHLQGAGKLTSSASDSQPKRHVSCSGLAAPVAGPLGMGSVVAAGYDIQLTGYSERTAGRCSSALPQGPHVLVGLLVGDEVNGSLAG